MSAHLPHSPRRGLLLLVATLAGCPGGPAAIPGGKIGSGEIRSGTIAMIITADRGAISDGIVSLAVPFPPGVLFDGGLLRVVDNRGAEVPARLVTLATWPRDGSLRSVAVAFRATIAAGRSVRWHIEYGRAPTARPAPAAKHPLRPDGPAVAVLDPAWYARSRVIGYQIPASENRAFPGWEEKIERYLAAMDPPWRSYGMSCRITALERTYYDAPHALFQRFIHRGTPASYRRAREEAEWYRDNELAWHAGGEVATYACAESFAPDRAMEWKHLRSMLAQGMLDDYLLTGDPDARRALTGLGEAYRRNLPALMAGDDPALTATERNLAWPLMGLASYYAIDHRTEVRAALDTLIGVAARWQGESGAFERDLHRSDPWECGDGPRGGSPFMTSLLVDGLMDAYFLTGDRRIPGLVLATARWLRDRAVNRDGVAFQYLWGCRDTDYHNSAWATLNLLISHVFGAAYALSGDSTWLGFGDRMAESGIAHMYAGRPKNWNQSVRTFLKYIGYRAHERSPGRKRQRGSLH